MWLTDSEKACGNCSFCSVMVLPTDGLDGYWIRVLLTLLQLVSGELCQNCLYYLLANLRRITWIFASAGPVVKSHLRPVSLPPLLLPLIIDFWNGENSQDVTAGWHEWVPAVLTDLLKDLFFA